MWLKCSSSSRRVKFVLSRDLFQTNLCTREKINFSMVPLARFVRIVINNAILSRILEKKITMNNYNSSVVVDNCFYTLYTTFKYKSIGLTERDTIKIMQVQLNKYQLGVEELQFYCHYSRNRCIIV